MALHRGRAVSRATGARRTRIMPKVPIDRTQRATLHGRARAATSQGAAAPYRNAPSDRHRSLFAQARQPIADRMSGTMLC